MLLEKGYKVRVLDSLVFGDRGIKDLYHRENFSLMHGDICNVRDVTRAIEGADIVIDLAAIVGDPACDLDHYEAVAVNYESTKVLIELSKRFSVKKFIFASTCSVYGASKNDILTEESELSPVSLYAETKNKEDSINKFKNNEARYLISHPRSGGHGLTFINCNTMIFFSLDYSYEAHSQARDRVHRIGQTNSCLYIYVIAKDSIDEELLKVLQKKQNLQDAIYAIIRKTA